MHYRRLGRTGLKVSAFCLGTMGWNWFTEEQTAFSIMDAFVEHGGNFFDTADFYSRWIPGHRGGESEEVIGRWLKARKNRQQVIIATKVYQPMGDGPNERGLSRKHIIEGVDESLRRLQSDYIDLYQAHAFDAETPIDETLRAFDDLQRQGKVRYVGASNYPAWRLMEALWKAETGHTLRYDTLEPHYNLVHRAEFEQDLKTICEQYQLGVMPYSPLANGFLSGKYRRGEAASGARAASVMRRYDNAKAWHTLETVSQIAQETGSTAAVVSLAWLLAQPVITAPIIGASSPRHLQTNLAALDLTLTADQLKRIAEASAWQEA
ncbi:aldo/keto reductase [Ktedonosporobacter rubrisoli]|uniref:Aldo/keto reductase n=1 Tax=Ktedonosporobacter rubrisoli TaxID=2509675 RepID=A0A4P6JUZ4_KTERU|nr:aldo/keto reductase [Ktedonosporobacter rubrisoli]QBD78766.1 aldo/keto reductase [Ktedonosporobacter rubrisoli]